VARGCNRDFEFVGFGKESCPAWKLHPTFAHDTASVKSAAALKFTVDLGTFPEWEESRDPLNLRLQLERDGKIAEALAEFQHAVKLDPRNAKSQNHLAWVLLVGPPEVRNPAEALLAATAAVAEVPNNALYLNTLGVALCRTGKWDDAIVALNKSVSVSGAADGFDAFFLAMAHWQRGEKEVAGNWLAKAATWMDENSPNDPELIEIGREAESLVVLDSLQS
jgi:tetratricopeptide (TPR) repeat protein